MNITFHMDPNGKPSSKAGKIIKLLLKLIVSALCLWYVAGKINWATARQAILDANPVWMFLAALAFVLSKIAASFRLRLYFRDIHVPLSEAENLRLYWLGMVYNLFLPGAISGDAYKVILLKQWFQTPYKKSSAAVLLDRLSGMLGLVLLLAVYGWMVLKEHWQALALTVASLISVLILFMVVKKWMRDFHQNFFLTLFLGLLVQGIQIVCVYCIMAGFHLPLSETAYIFLFLLSSIASVLPLTIGGLGIREMVFLQGSLFFGLMESNAVLISLVFYIITLCCSLPGLWFVFQSPIKKPDH